MIVHVVAAEQKGAVLAAIDECVPQGLIGAFVALDLNWHQNGPSARLARGRSWLAAFALPSAAADHSFPTAEVEQPATARSGLALWADRETSVRSPHLTIAGT